MAGPTRASGYTDYSSASASGFIPAIWSGTLVTKFYSSTVFGEIASTDYEGEISAKGDTVEIRVRPSLTITDYNIGDDISADYETPSADKISLSIDKAKKFVLKANDIDLYQSDLPLMDEWSSDAGEQMKIAIDTDVLGNIYSDVSADNTGATAGAKSGDLDLGVTGTPLSVTKTNVLQTITDLGQVLDEQNVAETGRWLILPAWMINQLKNSDLNQAYLTGDSVSPIRNGKIGMVKQH